jgi:diaminohydroxyphosphoribosylaminopyrimidine deaminase / 5-amino-6-(5-phosphoribosylamino)uracil reductase
MKNLYLKRAIQISKLGKGSVSPNPEVGALLVSKDNIINEAWHEKFGEAHAEVNLIENNDLSLLENTFVYVTLEPCNHHGKTPPCTDLIIKSKIPKVVISKVDKNPLVNGTGIDKLQKHNIEVKIIPTFQEGLLPFIINKKLHRPYIILKWVASKDGFIGKENEKVWLSNKFSNILSHKWRSEIDAILIGKNTALLDNPSLTNRNYFGKNPIRILFDSNLEVPNNYNIYDENAKTIVFNKIKNEVKDNIEFIITNKDLKVLCNKLMAMDIGVLLVEGGTKVIQSFIDNNLWDEARVITTPLQLSEGIKVPIMNPEFYAFKKQKLAEDVVQYYYNKTTIKFK